MRFNPFRKKKQPGIEQPTDVRVETPDTEIIIKSTKERKLPAKKGVDKQVATSAPGIKPLVYHSEDELVNISKGKLFQEKERRDGGVQTDGTKKWDKERIRAMLIETDPEKLPMLTVTRKGEFSAIVRATTFDEVARLGQSRDLRKSSFVSLYIHNRDVRAPSAFPEEGDSRKELMKQLEYMIAEEQTSRDMMKYGGV